jgi:hypothetical protein
MNADSLAAFLKNQSGFEGMAYDLFAMLISRTEFLTMPDLPACSTDFLFELRNQLLELEARGVEVVMLGDGAVRIKTTLETRDENLLRAQWRDNPQLRREFSCFESYAAYERAYASGRLQDSSIAVSNDPNLGSESKTEPESTFDPNLPFDEQCRQRWDLESATRDEFRENYDAYLAYEKAVANGQVLFRDASPPTGTHTQQVAEMLENSAPDPVEGVAEQQREPGSPAPDANEHQG